MRPPFLWMLAAGGMLFSCGGTEILTAPSYLLVELVQAETAATKPGAARVVVSNADSTITTLCVNIQGEPGAIAASFVLRRDAGKPVDERITIAVTPFFPLTGLDNAAPGKEFACPAMLPPPLRDAQTIEVDFCETQTRRLVFHVGAACTCAPPEADASAPDAGSMPCACGTDFTCGAGLSSTGAACGPSSCCTSRVSSACALGI